MKEFLLLSVVAVVHQACGTPSLPRDPETTDCIEWYDNAYGETCEEVRKYWGITPQMFHDWNPSVGLDCKPWEFHSYCILSKERWDAFVATATATSSTSITTTSTTSVATLAPSPTSWIALGCYYPDSYGPILEEKISPEGGDSALSIPKCKNTCYLRSYEFAGVQEGNQCWCSNYVSGYWTNYQTDCNIPCTGDKNASCGGKGIMNVFGPDENDEDDENDENVVPLSVTTSSVTVSSIGSAVRTVLSATPSSGAIRNIAMFF